MVGAMETVMAHGSQDSTELQEYSKGLQGTLRNPAAYLPELTREEDIPNVFFPGKKLPKD